MHHFFHLPIQLGFRRWWMRAFQSQPWWQSHRASRALCCFVAISLSGCARYPRERQPLPPKPAALAVLREPSATPSPSDAAWGTRELERGPRGHREIALTFDAGGEADALPALLGALREAGIHATFFLTGDWVQQHRGYAASIAFEGHDIGNHTSHHQALTHLSEREIADEIERADTLLARQLGQPIRPLFRAPYGASDRRVREVVGRSGYRLIGWSLDTLDSMEPRKTPEFIRSRILARSDADLDGVIILMHVGYPETAQALPDILRELRMRGFKFVTVGQWL